MAAALLAACVAAGAGAAAARADGDPASDYLIQQRVFLPYDVKIPKPAQRKLVAAVASANKGGFPVRVALIWSDYDLGSVTALWRKPKVYAKFLGIELSYYFKGHLLVVMPAGLGVNWPKHDTTAAYRTLADVRVQRTPAGLANAATEAVRRLASAAGVKVSTAGKASAPAPVSRNARDRITIVVAVLVALALGGAARFLVRRRAASAR